MQVPFLDYWWLAPLAGVGFVAYRFLGWRGLLAVVTLGLAGGIYTKGKTDERDRNERDQQDREAKARATRQEVENDIAKRDPDVRRNDLNKWLRDD